MGLPLTERQTILQEIFPAGDDNIRLSQIFPANGNEFFHAAEKLGLEGIMAKKADSHILTRIQVDRMAKNKSSQTAGSCYWRIYSK